MNVDPICIHDQAAMQITIDLPGGQAYARYRYVDTNTIDCFSTYVPTAHRGQGWAEVLVDAVVDLAANKNLSLVASCSYVALRLKRLAKRPS